MPTKTREHGTRAKYVVEKCRCPDCRAANAAAVRKLKTQVEPPYVDAERARRHVNELRAAGLGCKTIAERAGVAASSVGKLIYGDPTRGRGPSKRIRPETERALLAVTPNQAADRALVDAAPTWRVIETLLDRGWSKTGIARAIGQKVGGLQLGRDTITAANARAVKALLDQPVVPKLTRAGLPPKGWEQPEVPARPQRPARATPAPMFQRPEWMAKGACRTVETWVFFPSGHDDETVVRAKEVCSWCPVADECRAYAAATGQVGVWGGVLFEGLPYRDRAKAS